MYIKTLAIIVTCIFIGRDAYAQLLINEVSSSNKDAYIDANGDSPDWIELYNPSDSDINLLNYCLADNTDEALKWKFPSIIIPANGFLLIAANGENTTEPLSTNYKINKGGEEIILSDPTGNRIDYIRLPVLESDITYGRIDGSWQYLKATPGTENKASDSIEKLDQPSISITGGSYESEVEISLSHSDDANIFYKINSRSKKQEIEYETPIVIDKTSAICYWAESSGKLDSDITCETFFINDDYTLPIISVVGDSVSLFSYEEGIFELGPNADSEWPHYGANFWSDEEVPVDFQYFKNGEKEYQDIGALQIHGGREARNNPMRSFRIEANHYADKKFDYPFYSNKPKLQSVKKLVVRNASGDFNAGHIRDGFVSKYVTDNKLDIDVLGFEQVICFLNGKYYGVMALREKADEYYIAQNYGISVNDLDLLDSDSILIRGTTDDYAQFYDHATTQDLTLPQNYQVIKDELDIDSYIDYWIVELGLNNKAWPHQNIRYWKEKAPGAKWRNILFDLDIVMWRYGWTIYSEDIITQKMESYQDTCVQVNVFKSLMNNEEFKNQFLNRHQDLFNTIFETETFENALDELVSILDPEMPKHFGTYDVGSYDDWHDYHLYRIREYMHERPAYARTHLDQYFDLGGEAQISITSNKIEQSSIHLNSLANITLPFNGYYFQNIPIQLTAETNDLDLEFDYWLVTNGTTESKYPQEKLSLNVVDGDEIEAIYSAKENNDPISKVIVSGNQILYTTNLINEVKGDIRVIMNSGATAIYKKDIMIQPGQNSLQNPNLPSGSYILLLDTEDIKYSYPLIIIQ